MSLVAQCTRIIHILGNAYVTYFSPIQSCSAASFLHIGPHCHSKLCAAMMSLSEHSVVMVGLVGFLTLTWVCFLFLYTASTLNIFYSLPVFDPVSCIWTLSHLTPCYSGLIFDLDSTLWICHLSLSTYSDPWRTYDYSPVFISLPIGDYSEDLHLETQLFKFKLPCRGLWWRTGGSLRLGIWLEPVLDQLKSQGYTSQGLPT